MGGQYKMLFVYLAVQVYKASSVEAGLAASQALMVKSLNGPTNTEQLPTLLLRPLEVHHQMHSRYN